MSTVLVLCIVGWLVAAVSGIVAAYFFQKSPKSKATLSKLSLKLISADMPPPHHPEDQDRITTALNKVFKYIYNTHTHTNICK